MPLSRNDWLVWAMATSIKILLNVGVVARGLLGVGDDQVDGCLLRRAFGRRRLHRRGLRLRGQHHAGVAIVHQRIAVHAHLRHRLFAGGAVVGRHLVGRELEHAVHGALEVLDDVSVPLIHDRSREPARRPPQQRDGLARLVDDAAPDVAVVGLAELGTARGHGKLVVERDQHRLRGAARGRVHPFRQHVFHGRRIGQLHHAHADCSLRLHGLMHHLLLRRRHAGGRHYRRNFGSCAVTEAMQGDALFHRGVAQRGVVRLRHGPHLRARHR